MKQFLILAKTKKGQVNYPPCRHFISIRFDKFLWKFSQKSLENFTAFIANLNTPEGFAKNEMEPDLAVIALQNHSFMGLFSKSDVAELNDLLYSANIELSRHRLELQFQESMKL